MSRTVVQGDKIKAVVFGFGQGQELSEHTAAKPAMLFFVKGEASVGLGDDVQVAQAGTWVNDTTLMRLAGRFGRRVRGWAKKHNIPVVDCEKGVRKDRLIKDYIPSDPKFVGVFAIFTTRRPSPVWRVLRTDKNPTSFHLQRKDPHPWVKHYHFHIMDPTWGHLIVSMSGQLSHGDPTVVLPDRHRRPDDRRPDDQNVHRGQRQIPHPELNRGEDQVRHEVDGKGQGDQPRHFLSDRLYEDEPEANEDDRVQNLPDQANGPRSRGPAWFRERVVPVEPSLWRSSLPQLI